MALERRTYMLKVTSEIYLYNIRHYIGYDIGNRVNIEVFSSMLKENLRYHFSIGHSKITLLAILRYRRSKLRYRKEKNYNIVHYIVTLYEDAPNPPFLPPNIKPDIVEKEQISMENMPAISLYKDVV
jgi:hypothetical protein